MTRPIVRRPAAWLLGTAVAGVVIWAMSGPAVAQDKEKPEAAGKQITAKERAQAPVRTKARQTKPMQRRGVLKTPELQGPPAPGSRSIKVEPAGKAGKGAAGKGRGRGVPKPTVVLKPGEVPAIKFDVPVYDFGRVRAGEDVIHDFWFTNTGTGPLEILRVKPG